MKICHGLVCIYCGREMYDTKVMGKEANYKRPYCRWCEGREAGRKRGELAEYREKLLAVVIVVVVVVLAGVWVIL